LADFTRDNLFKGTVVSIFQSISDWYQNLSVFWLWIVRILLLLLIIVLFVYHFYLPAKWVHMPDPVSTNSTQSREASQLFWKTFHSGETNKLTLDAMIKSLSSAQANDKDSLLLSELLASAHYSRYQLRSHWGLSASEMVGDLESSKHYAERAIRLDPDIAHSTMPSLKAMNEWNLATLNDDQAALNVITIDILENTFLYPEFASFIQAWVLTAGLQYDDPHAALAKQGMDFMLESCAGMKVPDGMKFTKFTQTLFWFKIWLFGPNLCYTMEIAPHNIEGSFLNKGDILLKAGLREQAITSYENIKVASTYDTWKFKSLAEDRLSRIAYFEKKFREDSGKLDVEEPAMGYQSQNGCAVCHTN
jgi:tetratricopeptide (TPR) repeat protein